MSDAVGIDAVLRVRLEAAVAELAADPGSLPTVPGLGHNPYRCPVAERLTAATRHPRVCASQLWAYAWERTTSNFGRHGVPLPRLLARVDLPQSLVDFGRTYDLAWRRAADAGLIPTDGGLLSLDAIQILLAHAASGGDVAGAT